MTVAKLQKKMVALVDYSIANTKKCKIFGSFSRLIVLFKKIMKLTISEKWISSNTEYPTQYTVLILSRRPTLMKAYNSYYLTTTPHGDFISLKNGNYKMFY